MIDPEKIAIQSVPRLSVCTIVLQYVHSYYNTKLEQQLEEHFLINIQHNNFDTHHNGDVARNLHMPHLTEGRLSL